MLYFSVADIKSCGDSSTEGAIVATLNLEEFVADFPRVYIDLCKLISLPKPGRRDGGVPTGIRVLFHFLRDTNA